MKEWFVEKQTKIALFSGLPLVLITLLVRDARWPLVAGSLLISLIFIFASQKLFLADTSENWLKLSFRELLRNVLSGALMLLGWSVFLRNVVAVPIAAVLLWMG